jgi:hypothetical protein
MKPLGVCLIPSIRDSKASAEADGWRTDILVDDRDWGPSRIRESLLNRVFADPSIKFLRYLDDDDLLLPHQEIVQQFFESNPTVDLVYTDAVMNMPSGVQHRLTYSGDPYEDLMLVHPWSWIIRTNVARRIKDTFGYFWDYNRNYREGSYLWLRLLQGRVKMHYLPTLGYQYNKSFNPNCISQHPGFSMATKALLEDLRKHPAQTR